MKYTIQQLRKLSFPHKEVNTYDFSEELNGFEDIISAEPARVEESISFIGADSYEVRLNIEIKLYIACSVTLESIPYVIKTNAAEYYTFDKETSDNGDFIFLDGITLDTRDDVLAEILIEKPMRTTKEGVYFEDEIEEVEEEKINPAFAGLKDLFNK